MVEGQLVAPLIVQSIGEWSDTLSTLGLAINGGIAALSVQIFLHNQNQEQPPLRLRALLSMVLCFILQGANIVLGFLVHGGLIAGLPVLISAQYESGKSIEQNPIPILDWVTVLATWQFGAFITGVLILAILIPFNWGTLRGIR